MHGLNRLDAIVHATKRVFVGFACFCGFGVCVVLSEVSGIPVLHGEHRMVRSGEGFFSTNGVHPFIDRFFVGKAQLIKIGFAPNHGTLNNTAHPSQLDGDEFNGKLTLRNSVLRLGHLSECATRTKSQLLMTTSDPAIRMSPVADLNVTITK